MSLDLQETSRGTRKSLKTLQQTADGGEELVGRSSKSLKHQLSQDSSGNVEAKRKVYSTQSKGTQTDFTNQTTIKDLTDPDGASAKYWQTLANKRQVTIDEAYNENDKLRQVIENLKEELSQYKQMLEEANSFIEVIKEEISNNDDTGIDVNDVSTADESTTEPTDTTAEN